METIILTYNELAERLGIKPQSARKLVQRKKWKRVSGNDGTMRIHVPLENMPCTKDSHADTSHPIHELQKKVAVLETELKNAVERIEDLKADRDAWRQQAQAKRFFFWRKAS